ncbi:uncharacterized protein LOC105215990 [Zeugodacus cucurbitae]|uniref:uncharacterized protein LOC105215990 n=1 Tax=Zeugodacus cucurbitae TaxID=28588 RepID=UPI000596A0C3|nr:uncharacterized protein LOC105215990 [Zeugodacus cucurbitae]
MVEKFCCFRLESTAKFFAWLGIIGSVLLVIISIFGIANAHDISINLKQHGLNIPESDIKLYIGIYIVLCIVNVVASIFLLLGTIKKRHGFIMVWLICSALGILFSVVFMFYTSSYSGILGLALNIYLWIAMYSLYKRIQMGNETTAYQTHAEYMPKQIV